MTDLGAEFADKQSADFIWEQRRHPTLPTQDLLSGKATSKSIPPHQGAGKTHKGAGKLSPIELKAEILRQIDAREDEIVKKLCGKEVLTGSQRKIIIALHRGGDIGVCADELQQWLGYSPGATTNTANTAIYQLRKIFGKDFITNKNGRYQLGKL